VENLRTISFQVILFMLEYDMTRIGNKDVFILIKVENVVLVKIICL